ncbi:MAG: TraR/DksA C4-type zinc finger protein [bacterium]
MSANMNIQVMDNPIDMSGAAVWNRLHSERESICEAVIQDSVSDTHASRNQDSANSVTWHLSLLQARLTKVDDALDRLMSGSYGNCCACGKWIEDTKLEFDPAIAFCLECWGREQRRTCDVPPFEARDESKTLPRVPPWR